MEIARSPERVLVFPVDLEPWLIEHKQLTQKMLKEGVTLRDVERLTVVVNKMASAVARGGTPGAETHLHSYLPH